MKFAVMGGDQRIARLARLLAEDGHGVSVFALEKAGTILGADTAGTLSNAVQDAECVILPLPVSGQDELLNTPLSEGKYTLDEVFSVLSPNQIVCAGRVDSSTDSLARRNGIEIIDYFKREELIAKNALATAEGALGIMMQETTSTLWGSSVLVIGFGRIGKLLAHRLHGMGAAVAVSARSFADLAWIELMGYRALNTNSLEGFLDGFDIIVNTVPSPVLLKPHLREIKPGALCLDLASKPGGIDFSAASQLGIKVIWSLGLPGEVAPASSAAIIKETIYNILEELNGKD